MFGCFVGAGRVQSFFLRRNKKKTQLPNCNCTFFNRISVCTVILRLYNILLCATRAFSAQLLREKSRHAFHVTAFNLCESHLLALSTGIEVTIKSLKIVFIIDSKYILLCIWVCRYLKFNAYLHTYSNLLH